MRTVLEGSHLVKEFGSRGGFLRKRAPKVAVNGVSLQLLEGETYGLAGESGSGKSTLARLILGLIRPTSGEVRLDGVDLVSLRGAELLAARRQIQIIAQDPSRSLNPRHRLATILSLPFRVHMSLDHKELRKRVAELLSSVGLSPPAIYLDRYPHELSGGQRQRVAIARAMALQPRVIVADEAVSALDVSVRAQILRLMQQLQADHGLTYLFITHDLAVLRSIADRIGVMYLGKIVEEAPRERLYATPLHPYTQALLAATPVANPHKRRSSATESVPGALELSTISAGCPFEPNCPGAMADSRSLTHELVEVGPGHRLACHVHTDESSGSER